MDASAYWFFYLPTFAITLIIIFVIFEVAFLKSNSGFFNWSSVHRESIALDGTLKTRLNSILADVASESIRSSGVVYLPLVASISENHC